MWFDLHLLRAKRWGKSAQNSPRAAVYGRVTCELYVRRHRIEMRWWSRRDALSPATAALRWYCSKRNTRRSMFISCERRDGANRPRTRRERPSKGGGLWSNSCTLLPQAPSYRRPLSASSGPVAPFPSLSADLHRPTRGALRCVASALPRDERTTTRRAACAISPRCSHDRCCPV